MLPYPIRYLMLAAFLLTAAACTNDNGQTSAPAAASSPATAPLAASAAASTNAEAASAPVAQWKTVQTASYDWAGDGSSYEFTLSIPDGWNDPGDFTRLQISHGGKVVYELTDTSGLVKYQTAISGDMALAAKNNLLSSPYLLLLPGAQKTDHPLLFLFGWAYGSEPGSARIIKLDEDGTPWDVFYHETFDVTAFEDLNHDGKKDLVGAACSSQTFGHDLLTYDPYTVFVFAEGPGASMAPDLALTEEYNKQNYYGWAGPDCREDIAVVQHPPGGGKPVILPVKQAEALFEKK